EDSLRSRDFIISWLNPTPHARAVYASCSALPPPHATLASRRPAMALPGSDLHRLIAPALPGAFLHPDHLVGAGQQRQRYGDAERACTLMTCGVASDQLCSYAPVTLHSTLDDLAKDRLHVCLRKRSQRLRAHISKGAAAQSKRSHGNIIGCLDDCDDVVCSQCPEYVLHVRSALFRHVFEGFRAFR